jgi:hypothetical protein
LNVPPSRRRSALAAVVLGAVLLRLALLAWNVASRPELFDPGPERLAQIAARFADPERPFMPTTGFEVGNVAYALVSTGEGYASPFGGGTGPTVWVAPGMAAVYAAAFALFGCHTGASVLALFAVALAASVAMALLAHGAAGRLFGGRWPALLAASLVALSPWDLRLFRSGSLHDLNLPGLALLVLVALLLRAREEPSAGRLAAFACAAAVATLVNPVLAAAAVLGFGYLVMRGRLPAGRAVAVFLVAQLALVGPWVLWQRAHLGAWVFVKSNLPFELWQGNRPGAGSGLTAATLAAHHPSQSAEELRAYRDLGEVAYVRARGRAFLQEWEAGRFARATARRAAHFFLWYPAQGWEASWTLPLRHALGAVPGLVLLLYSVARRRRTGRWLAEGDLVVYLMIAAYAAPYLVTGVMERYVVPVTPLVLVLAAGGIWRGLQPGA